MSTTVRIRNMLDSMAIATDSLTAATSLRDDLEVDSAEQVELVVRLEQEFGITLGPDAEKAITYGDLCDCVTTQLANSGKNSDNAAS